MLKLTKENKENKLSESPSWAHDSLFYHLPVTIMQSSF